MAVEGDRVGFDDSLAANVAAGAAFAARVRTMVDELADPPRPGRAPGRARRARRPIDLDPPASLDLRSEAVGSVVWCTGFTGDFSFADPGLVADGGPPRHTDGAGPGPGLWYLGLRWLRRRGSGILLGFPGDAAWVAGEVRA